MLIFSPLSPQGVKGDQGPPGSPGEKGDKVDLSLKGSCFLFALPVLCLLYYNHCYVFSRVTKDRLVVRVLLD